MEVGIDVDMDDLGLGGEIIHFARYAVVKTCTYSYQAIRLGYCHIGRIGAVHAEHAERERVIAREATEAHERVWLPVYGVPGKGDELL